MDNIDLIATDNTTTRPPHLILQQLQQTLDLWEMGLRTSGGALSAKKATGPTWISIGKRENGNINQLLNYQALFS